jgi:hypothetical protein
MCATPTQGDPNKASQNVLLVKTSGSINNLELPVADGLP